MWLLEYIYFQTYKWMHRQDRTPEEALAKSQTPLSISIGFYILGMVVIFDRWQGTNLIQLVAEYWPQVSENGKFLKPTHGLGVIIWLSSLIFISLRFHRKKQREIIIKWFDGVSKEELRKAPWIVMGFWLGAFLFFVSIVVKSYLIAWLVFGGLIIGNIIVYQKHYKGRSG